MLIRFSVANFLSFKEETTFKLTKGRERLLPGNICKEKKNGYKILKGAVIYGKNAAGKTNFVNAIKAARKCVIEGKVDLISDKIFKLDTSLRHKPTKFEFEIFKDHSTYRYSFSILHDNIVSESLFKTSYTNEGLLVFERKISKNGDMESYVNPKLLGDGNSDLFNFLVDSVASDRLFVSEIYSKKLPSEFDDIKFFKFINDVGSWFENNLIIRKIGDITDPEDLLYSLQAGDDINKKTEHILKSADTDIEEIDFQPYEGNLDNILPSEIVDQIKRTKARRIFVRDHSRAYIIIRDGESDNINIQQMSVVKRDEKNNKVYFQLDSESEGTRSIIDLMPLFLRDQEDQCIIIDELDRSLHPLITKMLCDLHYLSDKDKQLIISTHEHYLLNQEYFRRDQIWFVEKDESGASHLRQLSNFDETIRYDKDIRNDYLRGRLGAVPKI